MKKYFISALFLIILISGLVFTVGAMEGEPGHEHGKSTDTSAIVSGKLEEGVRVIEVSAFRYKFDPDPIVVNFGERVRLVVTSIDVTHGLAIPDFNLDVSVAKGETKSLEFTADKKGTFHAHCSVYCGPGHAHMHANLIVK